MDAGRLFGRGIGFPPDVGADGQMRWSEGEANVRESIRVILLTEPGERIGLPGFGAGLGRFLFEPNTEATRHRIGQAISRALAQWEPRITLEGVAVAPDPKDGSAALATIRYRLVATGTAERVSLTVALAHS